jgi:hypothetical protein
MSVLTLRGVKGSPLTNDEIDQNFDNLNTDKVEIGGDLSGSNTASPQVSGIRGISVSNTTPTDEQILSYSNNEIIWSTVSFDTTANTTTRTITPSLGSSLVLPGANSTLAGVMISDDKTKLDGIEAGAQVNVATNLGTTTTNTQVTITSSTGTDAVISSANATSAGILTSDDKIKLDNAENRAIAFAIALG